MSENLEFTTGVRIDAALDRIRSRAELTGMAGKWFVGKGSRIVETPELLGRFVIDMDESESKTYLKRLPKLIEQTQMQDEVCAGFWHPREGLSDPKGYHKARFRLLALFRKFRFRPRNIELVVSVTDKPVLREAIHLISSKKEDSLAARNLEATLRMSLAEFVKLEECNAEDLRELTEARKELAMAHDELAQKLVAEQADSDKEMLHAARVGLYRAASWFDHKKGFRFAEYAVHWIREAIEKRKKEVADSSSSPIR